jgi:hypothetical protein
MPDNLLSKHIAFASAEFLCQLPFNFFRVNNLSDSANCKACEFKLLYMIINK